MLVVGNKGENTVSFIDLATGEELSRPATTARAPHEIAISPDASLAAVVNYGDNLIDLFDTTTFEITDTIDLGENTRPHGIKWLADGRIVASTEGGRSIVEINDPLDAAARTVTGIKTDEDGTHMVVVSPDGRRAYTTNLGAGTVSLIDLDTDTLVRTVPSGAGTEGVDLTPDGSELWVSNREADTAVVFDAQTLDRIATIDVGRFPIRLLISPDGKHAVTSNLRDASLSVIDTETRELVRTIPVGKDQISAQVTILFSRDGGTVYVAETGRDTVAEVDFETGELRRRIPVGRQGDGLAVID
jgi:YVTN family beta-propeller protein